MQILLYTVLNPVTPSISYTSSHQPQDDGHPVTLLNPALLPPKIPCKRKKSNNGHVTQPSATNATTTNTIASPIPAARPLQPTPPLRVPRSASARTVLRQRAGTLRGRDQRVRCVRRQPHRDGDMDVPGAAAGDELVHGGARDDGRGGPRARGVVSKSGAEETGTRAGEREGRAAEEGSH